MPKATASPLIVPLSGTSPRELTILPPSVSPACVNTASEAREPIGLSTLSSQVPVTSVTLAAAGGGGGADCWAGVVMQPAAIDATAARQRRRKPGTRGVDIGRLPLLERHSLIAAPAACEPSLRPLTILRCPVESGRGPFDRSVKRRDFRRTSRTC